MKNNINILLVEDNVEILDLIELYLPENYIVFKAVDGDKAIDIFNANKIDIVVLDIMLPKTNGYELMAYIRKTSDIPIIIVSAKKLEHEIIIGLNKGADDYITKPFSPLELMARIDVLVRRFCNKSNSRQKIICDGLELDMTACELRKNGQKIELTGKEYKLLELFMQNIGRVITKNQLLDNLWGNDYFDDNVVAVYISRLREKIEDSPKYPKYILTIRGLGYKFNEKE